MKQNQTVMGVHASAPRPTFAAALLLSGILSLPFAFLAVLEFWVW